METWIKKAFEYTISIVRERSVKHELTHFDSGYIMLDVWLGDRLFVFQFENEIAGFSEGNEPDFSTVPDMSFRDLNTYRRRIDEIFGTENYRPKGYMDTILALEDPMLDELMNCFDEVMEAGHHAVIKWDGPRAQDRFTVMITIPGNPDAVFRKDGDDLKLAMKRVLEMYIQYFD
ncbi:MAG: hypothetical protein J7578_08625 [Chitinophagaceae bacterium]|nr:hypothetical protein [Chitinophagaceae bacterium]